jgi:hypothetical protein
MTTEVKFRDPYDNWSQVQRPRNNILKVEEPRWHLSQLEDLPWIFLFSFLQRDGAAAQVWGRVRRKRIIIGEEKANRRSDCEATVPLPWLGTVTTCISALILIYRHWGVADCFGLGSAHLIMNGTVMSWVENQIVRPMIMSVNWHQGDIQICMARRPKILHVPQNIMN